MAARTDRSALAALSALEARTFAARTPRSAALRQRAVRHLPNGVPMAWMAGLYPMPAVYAASGAGPRFTDVDGNEYLDFNVCDLSMCAGFGPPAVVAAVSAQIARGAHFLLPTEDAVWVAEELARLVGLPFWQVTLSATGANTEVLRLARLATGRQRLIVFGGHYHGHLDEALVRSVDGRVEPECDGLSAHAGADTRVLPFNDLAALERELASREVALVLTEPALTNCNVVLPSPGFMAGVRALTERYGTLLCLDEAHTFQFAHGGLTRAWQLAADLVVLGKGLGTGISIVFYGMSAALAETFGRHLATDAGPRGLATGGTTFASAVALAAARAALEHLLQPADYDRIGRLGTRLADGLEQRMSARGLPWRAFRLGPRSGYCLGPELPRNGAEAGESLDYEWIATRRIFMANRGVWDAVASAGPQVSLAHGDADIERYLTVAAEFLDAAGRPD
jgi:glutamate-1-semialdehyde 2,1-aminomutase